MTVTSGRVLVGFIRAGQSAASSCRSRPAGGRFTSHHEAKLAVFDYVETLYKPPPRASALGQISPVTFEARALTESLAA